MRALRLIILFYLSSIVFLFSQTADVTKGCIPLDVHFNSANLSSYFWDFKDGGSSVSQNPQHTFTRSGTFQVDLYEGQNGKFISSVNIKVFADPVIQFTASNLEGCSPLTTQFTSQIQNDPEIIITSVLWSFGDGNSSIQRNPSHTYNNAGIYNVSLSITTNYGECDKTFLVNNYINVRGVMADFKVSNTAVCNAPATLSITNLTKQDPSYTYSWDFGNGTNFNGFDPKSVTYLTKGNYTITLKVKDPLGCESTHIIQVSIGPPSIIFNFNDSICWPYSTQLFINSTASAFQWNFGANGVPQTSNNKNPTIRFTKPGLQRLTLSAFASNCQTDTSFNIFVEQIDTNFTILGPDCQQNPLITLTANQYPNYHYIWNDTIVDDFQYSFNYKSPQRDSFYRNRKDTVYQKLLIRTDLGCIETAQKLFIHQRPNAIMSPSQHEGCAPLVVKFSDASTSNDNIIRWTILYGDGQSKTFSTNSLDEHTYNQPGIYYVKLIIETSKNCIDTSEGFFIKVGEKINPTYKIDRTEICLGDSITINKTNPDPRIDTWHVSTDNGRFSHCWKKDQVTHQFINNPGVFPVRVTGEYNGCPTESSDIQMITVKGAKPNLHYMINCNDSNRAMFTHNSIGANKIKWEFGDLSSSNRDSLIHQYKNTGTYKVILIAEDTVSGCPALTDTRFIHVNAIKADLIMEDTACGGTMLILDAKNSKDVDRDCTSGFLWRLPDSRPRQNNKDTIHKIFNYPGLQEVTLLVTDINGCKDSITKKIYISVIDAKFEIDKSNICFPADVQFTDKSLSNNKIIRWNWSFNDSIPNPKHRFNPGDKKTVMLIATNELNCSDTSSIGIKTYTPITNIEFNKGPGICIGDSIQFTAKDYTLGGSHLNYNWNFGSSGTSKLQSPKISFNSKGKTKVILNYVEDSTGCSGRDSLDIVIVSPPDARFSAPIDSPLCYPHIFIFNNETITDSTVNYIWEFEKNRYSNLKNPVYSYGKGTHTVKLIAQSIFGCSDSISHTYTLVGPEGKISAAKPYACKGDAITFNALNLVDVATIQWEFNDGKPPIRDQQSVDHIFDRYGNQMVVLILKSSESGCEFIDTFQINVPYVKAEFENIDTMSYCPGLVVLRNLSQPLDSSRYIWEFGEGKSIDTSLNPITRFQTLGLKKITLTAIDKKTGCKDVFTDTLQLEDVTDFLSFPNVFSPNNDGVNDYFTVAVKKPFQDFVKVKTLRVYNRWGKLIYDNDNPTLGWDGKFDGVEAPVEVYAYFMEVEIKDCNNKSRKGNVTIVR